MAHLSGLASQADVWVNATDRTRRKQWAEARLAQPIPAVGSTNNATSSSVDNDLRCTEMGATSRLHRIQWTEAFDADLVRCNDAITLLRGSGRQRELVRCWLALHPTPPVSGPALSTRLYRICQLGIARSPVRAAGSPGLDRDSSDNSSTTTVDSWRPGGNTTFNLFSG